MRRSELPCPVCDTDIPLIGDELVGDDILCPVCGVTSRLGKKNAEDGDGDPDLEPDW
ncbi:MAG: hypothetical protein R3E88_00900 [Myxococcota bacterium]|nr:hypothetical protein [Myxococcales bacterium]